MVYLVLLIKWKFMRISQRIQKKRLAKTIAFITGFYCEFVYNQQIVLCKNTSEIALFRCILHMKMFYIGN